MFWIIYKRSLKGLDWLIKGLSSLSKLIRRRFMHIDSIDRWLRYSQRDPAPADFTIFDVSECSSRTESTIEFLRVLLEEFFFEPGVLDDLRASLGDRAKLALDAATPDIFNLRAGVFGEALSAEICERWHAYLVPLKRMRTTAGSPQGTDLLGLRIGDAGQISEVCYIECKLRTTNNATSAALEAYDQLLKVRGQRLPVILGHVLNYLKSTNSHLYDPFLQYMTSRAVQPANEAYRIALVWEVNQWSERVVKNLEDRGVELTPMTVDVVKIADLRSLYGEVYDSLGVGVVPDDD